MKLAYPLTLALLVFSLYSAAQKKPLDHTVYDSWESLGERTIGKKGAIIVYSVNVQEGDNTLYIQKSDGKVLKAIPRGYNATISANENFVVTKIKPSYKQTRDAKIAKKKTDEMPKDSLAIYYVGKDSLVKIPKVKSYALPEEEENLLVYLLEKNAIEIPKQAIPDSTTKLALLSRNIDSLLRVADSLKAKLALIQEKGWGATNNNITKDQKPSVKPEPVEEGTTLVVSNLLTNHTIEVKLTSEYLLSKNGKKLAIETTRKNADINSKASILILDANTLKADTILVKYNDAKNYQWDEKASQLVFVAERDSAKKEAQKFYQLYYYNFKTDTAKAIVKKGTNGLNANYTLNENSAPYFSKSGDRLFVGIAPILAAKDTSLPEFERVNVDVWNYKDDYLQTTQLYNLARDARKTYLARYDFATNAIVPLESLELPNIRTTNDGDGEMFYASTDFGKRIAAQWQGFTYQDVYAIHPVTGEKKLIKKDLKGNLFVSSTGKYALLYDEVAKKYTCYNNLTNQLKAVANDVSVPLFDVENDVPDHPNAYGIAKWMNNDEAVLIYDQFDIWKIDPLGVIPSNKLYLVNGNLNVKTREAKTTIRYVETNRDVKTISNQLPFVVSLYSDISKINQFALVSLVNNQLKMEYSISNPIAATTQYIAKAKEAASFLYTEESFQKSPNFYTKTENREAIKLSNTNLQQTNYNWGTANLYSWVAYTGKKTEGIVYKPENFDATKKYPMIVYFYERNNSTLYNYSAPAPTPSRLNIPFYVSRGYIVFVPDIWYVTGKPGKSAYNYIVSGTRALIKEGFIDSAKIALQGQSWGGYQAAQLITQTKLYAAAWAGAPVANMFSAYGGIRWESGLNRQFQYEHQQSRIGATIWEKPNLYIENSPLFHLPNVQTPMVIMANDADGAVPWYQGIELFTGLRRLGKPVWMLNYNGEAHNLVERKNRKDIQIRQQQFFDWILKGEKQATWLEKGVPAMQKGRTLGL